MDTVAYQSLLGDDVAYPEDRYHAYLKLFSHSWNFGRVDLGVLLIEWILYLIFTAFITVKCAKIVRWDFVYISIPLYIAVVLGCARTAFWYDSTPLLWLYSDRFTDAQWVLTSKSTQRKTLKMRPWKSSLFRDCNGRNIRLPHTARGEIRQVELARRVCAHLRYVEARNRCFSFRPRNIPISYGPCAF